jgi:hypothetical protein
MLEFLAGVIFGAVVATYIIGVVLLATPENFD